MTKRKKWKKMSDRRILLKMSQSSKNKLKKNHKNQNLPFRSKINLNYNKKLFKPRLLFPPQNPKQKNQRKRNKILPKKNLQNKKKKKL